MTLSRASRLPSYHYDREDQLIRHRAQALAGWLPSGDLTSVNIGKHALPHDGRPRSECGCISSASATVLYFGIPLHEVFDVEVNAGLTLSSTGLEPAFLHTGGKSGKKPVSDPIRLR